MWTKTKVTRISRQPPTEQIRIEQEYVDIVKYLSYLCSITTNDARCALEIKSRITTAKAAFKKKKKKKKKKKERKRRRRPFHQQKDLKFKEETNRVLQIERGFLWC